MVCLPAHRRDATGGACREPPHICHLDQPLLPDPEQPTPVGLRPLIYAPFVRLRQQTAEELKSDGRSLYTVTVVINHLSVTSKLYCLRPIIHVWIGLGKLRVQRIL